jgi:hypothetical protein
LSDPEWEERHYAYLGVIIKGLDAVPMNIGGMSDHAHILTGLKSKHRLDYFIRDLKADSSEWVRKDHTYIRMAERLRRILGESNSP